MLFVSNRLYKLDKDGNIININTNYEKSVKTFAKEVEDNNYGTETNPYQIKCVEDLVDLSYLVNGITINDNGTFQYNNSYKTFSNQYISLMKDLNFKLELSYEDSSRKDYGDINGNGEVEELIIELTTGNGWVCIGGYGSTKNTDGISGTINGNDKVISNLYINNKNVTNKNGLIGNGSNLEINGLGVRGNIYANSNTLGGIVGFVSKKVKIEKCYFSGKIENISTSGRTGGILGHNNANNAFNAYIYNCNSKGEIKAHNIDNNTSTGGIIGYKDGEGKLEIKNSYNEANMQVTSRCGGILGQGGGAEIYYCYNTGNITGENTTGGIVGYTAKIIENCYNTGKISATDHSVGGIAGSISGGNGRISKCYNNGEIIGGDNAGGILGKIYSASNLTVEQCYNMKPVEGSNYISGIIGCVAGYNARIISNYNIGEISASGLKDAIERGYSSYTATKIVSNCYYLSTCGATNNKATSKTSNELKNITDLLNKPYTIITDEEGNSTGIEFSTTDELQDVWKNDENNINDGYPILKWQIE